MLSHRHRHHPFARRLRSRALYRIELAKFVSGGIVTDPDVNAQVIRRDGRFEKKRLSLDIVVDMKADAANAAAPPSGQADLAAATGASDAMWQGRCIELEESMQKFRDQAQNIRELLGEKVR